MPLKRKSLSEPEAESDTLADLIAQHGGGNRAKLSRFTVTAGIKRWEYIDTVDVTPTLLDDVKQTYGGGAYRALVSRHDGTYIKGGTLTFDIAGKSKDPRDDEIADDRLTRLETALAQKTKPSDIGDVVKNITLVVTALGAVLTPIIPLLRANGGTDPVHLLGLLQDAETKGEQRGREYGKLLAGTGTDSLADVATKFFPPLMSLVGENMKRQRAESAPIPAPVPDAVAVVDALPLEYQWLPALRPFYHHIAGQARAERNPDIIADFALQQMDDTLLQAVTAAARRDDFKPVMLGELATVAIHAPDWLNDFLERIISETLPEIETHA